MPLSTTRTFFLIGLLAIAYSLAFTSHVEAAGKSKPNVLFLFTDDQRADTIGLLGNPHIHTPHLDDLAKKSFGSL